MAGLQAATHWNTVKDFRWHKTTHSPNWYEIPGSVADSLDPTGPAAAEPDSTTAIDSCTLPAPESAPEPVKEPIEETQALYAPMAAGSVGTSVVEDDDEM